MGLTLDQDEVMKSMLAAAATGKGKGRATDEDEDEHEESSGSEDESEASDGNDGAEEDNEESEKPADVEDSDDSSSEAGPSSPRAPPPTSQPSISRVNASKSAPTTTQTPTPAFSSEPKPAPTTTFESLGLSTPLISALGSINISKPTEIQSACVKAIMSGRDCIGGAKTGSGKTLAFALPIVERIARDPFGVWAVVLTPTR